MSASNWPKGVPKRKRRPESSAGVALLGAVVGGVLGGPPGALLGGSLGAALGTKPPLVQALREHLEDHEMRLVSLRRYGPRVAVAVFECGGQFDSARSEAPIHPRLRGEDLEDWLYGDLTRRIEAVSFR